MNVIFNRLKTLYDSGKATEITIRNAVARDWITADDYKAITGKKYVA